jgi:hypothetical protein
VGCPRAEPSPGYGADAHANAGADFDAEATAAAASGAHGDADTRIREIDAATGRDSALLDRPNDDGSADAHSHHRRNTD